MALTLYHSIESTCGQKVRLVLVEKGLSWDERLINLRKGAQFAPEYLALNPKGVVPTLIDNGHVIRESTIINEYVDQAFPDPPMRPADPTAQARMRLWTKVFDEEVHPAIGILTYATTLRHQMNERMSPDELAAHFARMPDPARRERQRLAHERGIEAPHVAGAARQLDRIIGDMETALADGPWLAGQMYTLADAAVAPYMVRLDMLRFSGLWRPGRSNVAAWFDSVLARDNVAALDAPFGASDFTERLHVCGEAAWPRIAEMLSAG